MAITRGIEKAVAVMTHELTKMKEKVEEGIVAGGAIEEPLRWIAPNAGHEGSKDATMLQGACD